MTLHQNLIALHFSAYVLTSYGQTVVILGNCPELGMWDSSRGFKLQTNFKQYPIWFSRNPIVMQQLSSNSRKLTSIEFKLAVLKPDGKISRWQNLKQNRNLSLKTSCSVFLTEGQLEAEYEQEIQDTKSTKINSTKQGNLSQIQQQSEYQQSNKQNILEDLLEGERKRSGSSGRPKQTQSIPQQKTHIAKIVDNQRQKNPQNNFSHSLV